MNNEVLKNKPTEELKKILAGLEYKWVDYNKQHLKLLEELQKVRDTKRLVIYYMLEKQGETPSKFLKQIQAMDIPEITKYYKEVAHRLDLLQAQNKLQGWEETKALWYHNELMLEISSRGKEYKKGSA